MGVTSVSQRSFSSDEGQEQDTHNNTRTKVFNEIESGSWYMPGSFGEDGSEGAA